MSSEIKREKNNLKDEEVAAQEEIWKLSLGFTPTAIVKCAIELGIPDILENHGSPMTLFDLASQLKCSQSSLYRIMRFLIHYKVFQETKLSETSIGYAHSAISRLLTKNGKYNMAPLLLLESTPIMLAPWHKLSSWVLGNEDLAFDSAHGNDLWGFNGANPGHSKLFNDAMACLARAGVSAMIEGCPEVFKGLRTLVDVGGGDGTALRLIVEAFPSIKGINFDLPHVVSGAPVSVGVEHVGGNMFDHVPKGDAVFLMQILHDWADDVCVAILRKCQEAVPQNTGKVIVVDAIVGREEDHEFKQVGLIRDMVMMAHTSNGKERTFEEWAHVFHEAGFNHYTIKHIRASVSVMEIYP